MNWIKRIFGIKQQPIEDCKLPFIGEVKRDGKPLYGFRFEHGNIPRTNAANDDLIMASLMGIYVADHDNVSQSVSNDTGFDNGFGGGDFSGSGAGGSWDSDSSYDSSSSDSSSYSND